MVFAIADPDLQATLVEPTGKRCRFLEEVIRELDLKNVNVVNERAEEHVAKFRAFYDVVCARAVAGLPVLAELCVPLVRRNGIFLAMKGDKGLEEAAEGTFAVKTLGCRESETIRTSLPDGSERVLLVYKKEKDTPEQYPRPYAKIRKKPLGSRK
jgi:16S rRNA (guanine527-N7)-methyltransferase